MSRITTFAAAALVGLASAAAPAFAQDRHDDRSGRNEMRQSRESMQREATAVYAEAKRECARRNHHERDSCLREARRTYDHEMAAARHH